MKKRPIFADIRSLAQQLKQVQEQARSMGLFCGDRELLSCPHCGNEEDVTIDGLLIVSTSSAPGIDTRLRFAEVDAEAKRHRCPLCRTEVVAQ